MIESPRAVLNLPAIAAASKASPLTAPMLGPNDLERTMGVSRANRDVARRHDIAAYGSPGVWAGGYRWRLTTNNYRDGANFAREVAETVYMGFDGKALIHPNQLDATNEAFAPRPDEIAWAQDVLRLFGDPETPNVVGYRLRNVGALAFWNEHAMFLVEFNQLPSTPVRTTAPTSSVR